MRSVLVAVVLWVAVFASTSGAAQTECKPGVSWFKTNIGLETHVSGWPHYDKPRCLGQKVFYHAGIKDRTKWRRQFSAGEHQTQEWMQSQLEDAWFWVEQGVKTNGLPYGLYVGETNSYSGGGTDTWAGRHFDIGPGTDIFETIEFMIDKFEERGWPAPRFMVSTTIHPGSRCRSRKDKSWTWTQCHEDSTPIEEALRLNSWFTHLHPAVTHVSVQMNNGGRSKWETPDGNDAKWRGYHTGEELALAAVYSWFLGTINGFTIDIQSELMDGCADGNRSPFSQGLNQSSCQSLGAKPHARCDDYNQIRKFLPASAVSFFWTDYILDVGHPEEVCR